MTSREVYDVAIIGLGPAGSTLARLLHKSLKVVAIDKKSPDRDGAFHKPCGGLLAPDAQKAISKFGLTVPKEILVDPQIFAVDTIDLAQNLQRHYQRFYINLDRHKFDLWLMSLIPAHVDRITPATCISIEKSNDCYIVQYKEDGKLSHLCAKYVVGADGANSKLRKTLYPHVNIKQYIAIQQWFVDINARPFYSCIFDSDLTDCYAWSISKDGHFILGGAFPIQKGKQNFDTLKEKIAQKGFMFDEPIKTEACLVLKPKGLFNMRTGKEGAFLIGEAAGFISPSSLEGISYAFNSACKLAKILNARPLNPNRAYFLSTLQTRLTIMLKNCKAFVLYTPFLRKLVMKSGIQKINMIEDMEK